MAAARVATAALQYSKWMSRFICWAWISYRFAALLAGIIRPEAASAFASTLVNLDWIMLVNEGTYLINSLGEKYIFSDKFILRWIDKGGFKDMISRIGLISSTVKTQDDQAENEPTEEEEDEDGGDPCG